MAYLGYVHVHTLKYSVKLKVSLNSLESLSDGCPHNQVLRVPSHIQHQGCCSLGPDKTVGLPCDSLAVLFLQLIERFWNYLSQL